MLARLAQFRDAIFLRYLLASVAALGVDVGTFLALLSLGAVPVVASAVGYALGIIAHWLLSSRTVFVDSVAARGPGRTRQKALFVSSALLGLGLTTVIVGSGSAAGIDPRLAKLVAVAVAFTTTWLLREKVVFRKTLA